jgi:uncharacterized membrane protein SirB2
MIEFYPQVKWLHVACVVASGLLFALRGALVLAGRAGVAMHAVPRYGSYAIDTMLLTAALMLATMLRQYPFVHGWLTVKVLLLVAYIVLGTFALRRARTPRGRALAYVAALATFAAICGVARAHHPLGWLAALS